MFDTNFIVLQDIDQWNIISQQHNTIKTIVLMFTGSKCAPCLQIKPRIKKLSEELTDVLFVIIDVNLFSQIATHFNIASMPTFIIIKNNNVVKTIVGGDLIAIRHSIEN